MLVDDLHPFSSMRPLLDNYGIDEDVGDILDVADFIVATTHFGERIIACRVRIGRIEEQAMREQRAEP